MLNVVTIRLRAVYASLADNRD